MRAPLVAAALLALALAAPVSAMAEARGPAPAAAPGFFTNLNRDLAMVGGAALGLVGASGAVNLIEAGVLISGGAPVFEALEAAAGLGVPMVLLGATLGAVFAQDFVYRNLPSLGGGHAEPEKPKAPAKH